MLIQGSSRSNRTERVVMEYIHLIEKGISASDILVLVQNPHKRMLFSERVKSLCNKEFFENPQIQTFQGLAYNTILNNWAFIENSLDDDRTKIFPNLSGLEISEIFMKQAVRETGFADYNSKINLLHQLFRRHSLIVQNNLSQKEIAQKSALLKESFGNDAKTALEIFKKKTLEYRSFDYIRQLSIFSYLYENTKYFSNIKYLFIDDADEITNAEFSFLEYLKPQLEGFCIGYDKYGPSRAGFLNGDFDMPAKLEKFSNEPPLVLDNIGFQPVNAESVSCTRRLEMLNSALNNVKNLINEGAHLNEICIISPIIDSALKFCIKEKFQTKNVQFISGSEKLIETPCIKNYITILKLASFEEEVSIDEIKCLLNEFLKIPVRYCLPLIESYKSDKKLNFSLFKNELSSEKTELFKELFLQISQNDLSLYEKALIIFDTFFCEDDAHSLEKINFFIKQLEDFEKVFQAEKLNPVFQKAFLTQLESSIVSENPPNAIQINDNFLIVSTAQKLIDLGLKRRYQIWLDITSSEWVKQDLGTIYNAWVFQASWGGEEFTFEKNLELSEAKIKRQIRKTALLCGEKIYSYSSLFDINGLENQGGIEKYFSSDKNNDAKIDFKFIPREDQKPVLNYKKGKLAVSAVPGAGKTTILLALIIKLIKEKVSPDKIFVLTYMDSAARNFKERIKKICPNQNTLPNISTIHGLALRILKENGNYLKAGLEEDFQVIDENERQKIIRELLSRVGLEQDYFDKYEKGISALKLSGCSVFKKPSSLEAINFLKFYNYYNSVLKKRSVIDYDDMLVYSVKLLEEEKDIREFYNSLCEYIIEDEAQDSSVIQQRLINLLGLKHGNIIRCGDINQSITGTFTNADTEGFKEFITSCKNVSMLSSQRCHKEIFSLANDLIDYSKTLEPLKNAFYDIKMKEVEGKNPPDDHPLNINVFEDYNEERSYMVSEVRKIFNKNPNSSVAILLRNNYQTPEYEEFLASYGYTVITRSDALERQPVFNLLFSILKFCEHPWQNEKIIAVMEALLFQKFISFTQADFDYLKSLKTPILLEKTDSLPSAELTQLIWDLNYWLENSSLPIDEFVLKAGNYYFTSEIEKSNVYLLSGLFKKLSYQYKTDILSRIEEISKKPGQYKFFTEEDKKSEQKTGIISIMTYHKSKGDEFDYVFIPSLTDDVLYISPDKIKIKADLRFLEHIKSLNPEYKPKNENDLKIMQAEENLRIIYVALTRAKKRLYLTCSKKYKKFSRVRDAAPNELFDSFLLCRKEHSDV